MKKLTTLFLVLLFSLSYLNAATFYVHTSGDDTNNGTSWATAFETLQKALEEVEAGDEIWVAAGTYYPTSDYGLGGSDRYMHFRMKNGVTIYGGFPGPRLGNL